MHIYGFCCSVEGKVDGLKLGFCEPSVPPPRPLDKGMISASSRKVDEEGLTLTPDPGHKDSDFSLNPKP